MKKVTFIFVIAFLIFSSTLTAVDNLPRWGVGMKFAGFGIPDIVLDQFVFEHPSITGSAYAFDLVAYSSKGPRASVATLFSLEYSRAGGHGFYRENEGNERMDAEVEVSQVNLSATILISMFPRLAVHPFIGFGLGVSRVHAWYEGVYVNYDPVMPNKESSVKNLVLPVLHIPIGLMINISDRVMIRLEGGFKNGLYYGASVVYNL